MLARAGANPRCGDQLVDAADLLVEWCEQLSFDEARICITRWESLADADGAHRDRAAAEEQRRAFVGIDDDGAVISASGGSPLVAEEMRSTFDRFVQAEFEADAAERTRRFGPDAPAALLRRTDAQRRFDALTALFRAAASVGHGVGVPASVVLNIVSDERSLSDALSSHGIGVPLGYSGNATSDELVSRRCETESGMQLTAEDLVGIASNEHIRHVIVDSAGTVIDWGRKRRLFTGAAREAALFRARRCGRIGSAVHRGGCQVDHRRGWSDGGRTDQDNADGYCSHDNRKKHELGIIVKRSSSGYIKLAPTRRHVSRSGRPTAPPGRRRARRQSAPTARCAHRRYVIRILIGRRDADG